MTGDFVEPAGEIEVVEAPARDGFACMEDACVIPREGEGDTREGTGLAVVSQPAIASKLATQIHRGLSRTCDMARALAGKHFGGAEPEDPGNRPLDFADRQAPRSVFHQLRPSMCASADPDGTPIAYLAVSAEEWVNIRASRRPERKLGGAVLQQAISEHWRTGFGPGAVADLAHHILQ